MWELVSEHPTVEEARKARAPLGIFGQIARIDGHRRQLLDEAAPRPPGSRGIPL